MEFLACTDGSPYAEKAVKASAVAAKHANYGLTLLYVIEDVVSYADFPDDKGFRMRKEKGDAILAKAKEIVEEVSKDIECSLKIAHGPVSSEIARIAVVGDYSAIFLGTKGTRGIKRMLFGTVADDVIRHAHCPVTVVR
jgi:nucleotide-binding universal stress UspA family protein